jgi:hypothetical protein
MGYSPMITLFSEPEQSRSFPSTYVISIVFHAAACSLFALRLVESHHIIERFPESRFAVRVLDFHSTQPQARQSSSSGIAYRGPVSGGQSAAHPPAPGGSSSGSPAMTHVTAQLMPAPQTLLQPDLPKDLTVFKKVPVPLVVLWSPEKPAPQKKIVPPTPDKPAIALVRPSLDTPIKEENLADLRISSTVFVTQSPTARPSTTSPVVVHGPEETKKVPQTTSKPPEPQAPTPVRVLSLSDTRVAQGTVAIPMANQSSAKSAPGAMVPGQLKDPSPAGTGNPATKNNGSGTGSGAGDRAGNTPSATPSASDGAVHTAAGDPAGKGSKTGPGRGGAEGSSERAGNPSGPAASGGQPGTQTQAQNGAAAGPAQGPAAGSGSGAGIRPAGVHISLPKDGQFGVVVVGSSIAESYPETAELWSGRMASTVYLRVGLPKSWILQYALPRLVDAAAEGGRLEAPWPYEIVRPNLDLSDMDADALILHGFVNKDGRFEKLEVAFPAQFVQAAMVLNVLNQWQFRPARQNGQMTPVEVLLIIPEQTE